MSDTPRTDAASVKMERLDGDIDEVVSANFARKLEQQLAAHIDYERRVMAAVGATTPEEALNVIDGMVAAAPRMEVDAIREKESDK